MFRVVRNKNFYIIFLIDAFCVIGSLYLAYAIRFEFWIPSSQSKAMVHILPWVFMIKMFTFFFFGLYQGMWRYTGLEDLLNACKAAFVSTMCIVMLVLMRYRFQGYPRSVFILDCLLTLFFIVGIRVGIRLYFATHAGFRIFPLFSKTLSDAKRLLIIGAGDAGETVLREILGNPALKFIPAGFLDNDPQKHGKTIHRIEVLGKIDQIESYQKLFDEILIALPSVSGQTMRKIVAACEKTGKPFRTVPTMGELIDGKISMKAVRKVTIQDLLNREEVRLDETHISSYLRHKRVLVTGAGGSIGSELVRQIGKFEPEALGLVELSEYNLFQVDNECHHRFRNLKTRGYLADTRNFGTIQHIFEQFRPQVVFHAAAYKHVPLQELHPWETVQNNILGTRNMIQTAREYEVEKFVLVSTDKAVRPASVMGATKRAAEKLIACANHHPLCNFMAVRFGNVIGSSGSVIPVFQEQIERGGPVTVTHPEVTRYFMSIPEASQLILQAGAMGQGGEIFILDMGQPVRILDLARDLIRLHGYDPERDIEIRYIGLRPGEKLYEELITEGEGIIKTEHKKIMVLQSNECEEAVLYAQIEDLLEIARSFDVVKIKQKLQEIVPEYTPEFF